MKVKIDQDRCISCGTCEVMCPERFEMDGTVARVKDNVCEKHNIKEVAESCPVGAITVDE